MCSSSNLSSFNELLPGDHKRLNASVNSKLFAWGFHCPFFVLSVAFNLFTYFHKRHFD